MSINLAEDIKPISYIKSNAASMLDYVNEKKSPIVITQHGEARGVMLDVGTYQKMLEAIAMMRLLEHSEAAITSGKTKAHKQVFAELEDKLADYE